MCAIKNVQKVLTALKGRRIESAYFPDGGAAKAYILGQIPAGASVGFGGSVTVEELSLYEDLQEKGCPVYWHWKVSREDVQEARLKSQRCDYYLCSSNAITEDGRLVNVDGTGNRVGALAFGPGKIIIIAGVNKIAGTLEEALERIKRVAVQKNIRRLNQQPPCLASGKCSDCRSPERVCCVTSIIEHKPYSLEIEVILVGENMGY